MDYLLAAMMAGYPPTDTGDLMAIRKTIVCLANSHKHSHRCIAGIGYLPNNYYEWVRPIGDREGCGVSELEIVLNNGMQPRPLDILEIGLTTWRPDGHQQENYLIDANLPWRWAGRYTWDQAVSLPLSPGQLWVNGHSTYSGLNNYVPVGQATGLDDSLRLIRTDTSIYVTTPYDPSKPLEVWAEFEHERQQYRLKVTDSIAEARFRAAGVGNHPLGETILTVSLGERWNDQFYKLVAAVIDRAAV